MIIPNYIKKGDKIGIVAPARKISANELDLAIQILNSWGLKVITGSNVFSEYYQFSGSDRERSSDMQKMIEDKEIKAIICARGGYGSSRIIDMIDFSPLQKNPKWIIGYSDITVFHSHLHELGIATLHASMPINFKENTKEALHSLRDILFGKKNIINYKSSNFNIKGEASGEVVGGNLSILYSLMGSKSDIKTEGKILFLEDLDEYFYHIDRMIVSLKRNGKFTNLKALIVGSFTEIKDNPISFGKKVEEIILENLKEYGYPICFSFPSGHSKDNRAILLGKEIYLNINSKNVILQQN